MAETTLPTLDQQPVVKSRNDAWTEMATQQFTPPPTSPQPSSDTPVENYDIVPHVGVFNALIHGVPSNRDSSLPYDPSYRATLGETLSSTLTDFVRSGISVASDLWVPEKKAARDSLEKLRALNPDAADQVEANTIGKKLTTTQSFVKGGASIGEGVLTALPFLKLGRAALTTVELGILGEVGKAAQLTKEASLASKTALGFGEEAIKGTSVEMAALTAKLAAEEATSKLDGAGKMFAQSELLQKIYSNGLSGSLYGGLYGLHTTDGDFEEGLKGALFGGVFGAGLTGLGHSLAFAGRYGGAKALQGFDFAASKAGYVANKAEDSVLAEIYNTSLTSTSVRLEKYFGEQGKTFMEGFRYASKEAQKDLGRVQLAMIENGLMEAPVGLGKAFKGVEYVGGDIERMLKYNQILRGLGAYEDQAARTAAIQSDPKLLFLDQLRKSFGSNALKNNVVDSLLNLDTYLPKHTPTKEMTANMRAQLLRATTPAEREAVFAKSDPLVNEMVHNSVAYEKAFKTKDEAYSTYYDYVDTVLGGSHTPMGKNRMLQRMVNNGEAATMEEARGQIITDLDFRKKSLTPMASSLDFQRKVNLPWYDANPSRVMPVYAYDAATRIEMAKKFGPNDEVINELIGSLKKDLDKGTSAEHNAKTFNMLVRTMTGQVERRPKEERASALIRSIEVLRLTFSPISNLGQTLNTLLASDFGAVMHGLNYVFDNEEIKKNIANGVFTNAFMRQAFEYNSGGAKWTETYMKAIGFTYTEVFNRMVAASASDKWALMNLEKLGKDFGFDVADGVGKANVSNLLGGHQKMEGDVLRSGLKIQGQLFDEYRKKYPNEDFTATIGNIGAAKKKLETLEPDYAQKTKLLQDGRSALEKELLAESEPLTREATQGLRDTLSQLKAELEKTKIPDIQAPEFPKTYTSQEVSSAVEGATQIRKAKLENVIARIEKTLSEQDGSVTSTTKASEQARPQTMKEIRASTQKNQDILEKKNAHLEASKNVLEKQITQEATPLTDSKVKSLRETIKMLKASIESYTGGNISLPADILPSSLTAEQEAALKEVLKGVAKDRRVSLKKTIAALEEKFDAERATGLREPSQKIKQVPLTPEQLDVQKKTKILDINEQVKSLDEQISQNEKMIQALSKAEDSTTGQIVADIHSQMKAIDSGIVGLQNELADKTRILEGVVDSFDIADKRARAGFVNGKTPYEAHMEQRKGATSDVLAKIENDKPREYYALKELGLPVDDIIARGFLTQEEKAVAAQTFVHTTQFLGHPGDLPVWVSSPLGKVMFQFKTYAYQQARFIKNEMTNNLQRGDYARFARNVLILGTVFPMSGEVIGDVRSLLTQEKRPIQAWDRYLSDLGSSGAVGLFLDFINNATSGNLANMAVGVAPGDAIIYLQQLFQAPGKIIDGKGDKALENFTKQLFKQTGVGRPVINIVYPSNKKGETSLESLSNWSLDSGGASLNPFSPTPAGAETLPESMKNIFNPPELQYDKAKFFAGRQPALKPVSENPRIKIKSTYQDKFGTLHELASGVTVREISEQTKKEIQSAYDTFPKIPKGFLEALYANESSSGTNDKNKYLDQGKYGWLVGFTKDTYKSVVAKAKTGDKRYVELLKHLNFDTKEEAIKAAAAYFDYRSKIHNAKAEVIGRRDNTFDVYQNRYNGKGSEIDKPTIIDMMNFYSQNS